MFKKLKIGLCILTFSMFALASTSFAANWPIFHKGNTLIKGKVRITDTLTVDGKLDVSGDVTFTGGRTVMFTLLPGDIVLPPNNPPIATITAGGTGNVWAVLQFDGGAGSADDHIQFAWVVPDGYVADSGRMNIFWSCESAETALDTVTFDMTVLAVTPTESVDQTPQAFTAVNNVSWAGVADEVFKQQLNFEVDTITVDDIV
ncbi:hypothetical protein LCGC14_2658810, partial [marine sediment metagenome]